MFFTIGALKNFANLTGKHQCWSLFLTLFKMGIFGAADGRGVPKSPLPKICHRHPTMMKLGTVIPYLRKIKKIYESRDTLSEFC